MTDLRQAAQQALEALEGVLDDSPKVLDASISGGLYEVVQCRDAITALREALAREHAMHEVARLGQEIEQEPSQWRDMVVVTLVREGIDKHRARELADHFAAQPEPVAWAVQACSKMWRGEFAEIDAKAEAKRIGGTCVAYPLYTAAAQRPWVGLTEFQFAEIYNKWNDTNGSTAWGLNQALEAKLRKLNT